MVWFTKENLGERFQNEDRFFFHAENCRSTALVYVFIIDLVVIHFSLCILSSYLSKYWEKNHYHYKAGMFKMVSILWISSNLVKCAPMHLPWLWFCLKGKNTQHKNHTLTKFFSMNLSGKFILLIWKQVFMNIFVILLRQHCLNASNQCLGRVYISKITITDSWTLNLRAFVMLQC